MSVWKVALSCGEVDAGTTSRLLYQRPSRKLASWRPVFETNHLFRCCRVGLTLLSVRRVTPALAPSPGRTTTSTIKRLTPNEIKEGRDKSLCFKCWWKVQAWSQMQATLLHWRVLAQGRYAVDDEVAETHMGMYVDEATLEISLHTILRAHVPQTMCVKGIRGQHVMTVLEDSGGTHNFLSNKITQKAGSLPSNGDLLKWRQLMKKN